MALVLADRVRDTTTTTGTGTVTLSGAAPTGYQNFSVVGNGNTTYYTINAGSQWEVGSGTYLGAGPTLSRDTVLSSSSGGSLVNFSAGTKDVFVTYPSGKSISDGYGLLPVANGGTGVIASSGANSVVLRNANQNFAVSNIDLGFTSIATAAGTTTLTIASTNTIYFTGTTTQTVVMPVTSTLVLGSSFLIRNNSTGNITVNSSGANLIATIIPGTSIHITCILTSGTTAASWDFGFTDYQTNTGTGNNVLSAAPTFTGTAIFAGVTASTSIATSSTATISFIGTGIIAIGATTGTAAITVGQSTGAQTLNLATGATLTATTKAVNIGTSGVAGSTTNITIGSTTGTSTTTLNGTVALASIITAPLGSAAAPSYTFTGDTNTGIFSPAADTIAFSEGGVEAMRIDSSGNVGIGNAAPGYKLEVTGDVRLGSGGDLRVGSATGTTTSGGDSQIFNDANNMVFTTGTTAAERMRIDSSGQVGVGCVPGYRLDVASADTTAGLGYAMRIRGNATAAAGAIQFTDSGVTTQWGSLSASAVAVTLDASVASAVLAFRTNSAERMRIDSTGNVGIGTTLPNYKLEVFGSPAWMRNFAGTPASPTETQDWPVAAFNVASYGDFTLQTMMAFTLPNDGNYFLGYAAWNFKLDQTASSTTSAGVNGMQFGGPGYLAFLPGTNEKARITSGGAFLVGTTSPLAGNTSNEFRNTTAGLWPLTLNANDRGLLVRNSNATSGFYAYFEYNGGTNNGSIAWAAGVTTYNTTSDVRIKKNIVDAPDAGSLIDAIKVRSWDFKADDVHWRYGMVAQELLLVAPEAVAVPEDPEMMMGVDYSKLVPMLIKEVQSLRARLALLEGK